MSKMSVVLLTVALASCAKQAERRSFAECFLDKVAEAATSEVAGLVRAACAEKYQQKLPASAVRAIAAQAQLGGDILFMELNNNNTGWTITEIEVSAQLSEGAAPARYRQKVFIDPLTNKDASLLLRSSSSNRKLSSWAISEAWGVETHGDLASEEPKIGTDYEPKGVLSERGLLRRPEEKRDCQGDQLSMNTCSAAEHKRLDETINDLYKKQMVRLTKEEAQSLRTAQRAWLAYIEADCFYQNGPQRDGGSIWPYEQNICLASHLRSRIDLLGSFVECTRDGCKGA